MRISDWSSDVCSSDLADQAFDHRARLRTDAGHAALLAAPEGRRQQDENGEQLEPAEQHAEAHEQLGAVRQAGEVAGGADGVRSEEHTSELQSLMRISYAVFCLKKKKKKNIINIHN